MAILKGTNGKDVLNGSLSSDRLYGYADNDTLQGGDGNDTLIGGMGNDLMRGGIGNDTYFVDSATDIVQENENSGIDGILSAVNWTLNANIERLQLIATAKNGIGNDLDNYLVGNLKNNILDGGAGNDILKGGLGIDSLRGGSGDDFYFVDDVLDVTYEMVDAGIDTVNASVSWTLKQNIENLVLSGTLPINGTGNLLSNVISGNSANNGLNGNIGNDILYGGFGNDTLEAGAEDHSYNGNALYGGPGDDLLIGSKGNDWLDGGYGGDTMRGGGGYDTFIVNNIHDVIEYGGYLVKASVNWTLSSGLNLTLTGNNPINGIGNSLSNTIIGNDADNLLNGGDSGNDILSGGLGNDILQLISVTPDDVLDGGEGIDKVFITGKQQIVDLRLYTNTFKNIEAISFSKDSQSTLKITAATVLAITPVLEIKMPGENTLIMDNSWTNQGIVDKYQIFTQDGATIKVDSEIAQIKTEVLPMTYIIYDATTALNVQNVFTNAAEEIKLDFGGKYYMNTGISQINLTGFGLEDKLLIAEHDGTVRSGAGYYLGNTGGVSRLETYHGYEVNEEDRFFWKIGATTAVLQSDFQIKSLSTGHNSIRITGLPVGLAASQIVFI